MDNLQQEIAEACKELRLSSNLAEQAITLDGETHQEYVLKLFTNELEYRKLRRRTTLLNTAGFPRRYSVDEFRTDEIDFPDEVSLNSLLELDFYHAGKNVIMYGGSGTGKTMLSILIGISACNKNIPVKFYRTAGLINLFSECKEKGTLTQLKKKLNLNYSWNRFPTEIPAMNF